MTFQTIDDTLVSVETGRRPAVPRWVSGFACGAVVGVVLGVTLAPARGRDTRRAIAGAVHKGRERAADAVARSRRAASRQHARVTELSRAAGAHVREFTGAVRERTQAAGSAFERVRRSGAEPDEMLRERQ